MGNMKILIVDDEYLVRMSGIGAKIIVLSGYDDFQYAKGAITYGASEYIVKPIENDKFIAAVVKIADTIRKERLSEQIGKQKLIGDLVVLLKKLRNRKTAGTIFCTIRSMRSAGSQKSTTGTKSRKW